MDRFTEAPSYCCGLRPAPPNPPPFANTWHRPAITVSCVAKASYLADTWTDLTIGAEIARWGVEE